MRQAILVSAHDVHVLIHLNGGIGAALGTALALLLSFALTWFVSSRVYPMPWLGRRSRSA